MPKATESHTSQDNYRVSPLSIASDITSPRQYSSITTTMQSSQHMSQPILSPYATGGPVQPLQYHHQQSLPQSAPVSVRASSGAWNPSDDAQLMSARAQGLNWQPIQAAYFPNKTPNACRKRHERLMDRRNSDDWDVIKLENMAKEYINMRRELWTQLGNKTGEKWNVVEAKCMQSGVKNLQSAARACARRERLENPHSHSHSHSHSLSLSGSGSSLLPVQHQQHHHHHSHSHGGGAYGDLHSTDDSGIGLDELDAEYHSVAGDSVSYGGQSAASLSPDDGIAGGGGGGGGESSALRAAGGPVKLYPAPVRGAGVGYDSRADVYAAQQQQQQQAMMGGRDRGMDRVYAGGSQQQQLQQQQQGGSSRGMQRPQYGLDQRLPSIDMNIGAIINRPLGPR